jgi:uncharacterized lipoprotein YddW (UPF0748 family)
MSFWCLLALIASNSDTTGRQSKSAYAPIIPRFEREAPLPTIPGVVIDSFTTGSGLAEEEARGRSLQARIMWIDATANIDRYNTEDKIVALVKQIHDVGFNTIVFDVKPISGQVVYPSKLAPKLLAWRGQVLPADFDPLAIMVREAKKNDVTIFASLNAFSEGHRLFNVGPGYDKPDQQTVLYEPKSIVRDQQNGSFTVSAAPDPVATDSISVYQSPDRLPSTLPTGLAVSLDPLGRVMDSYEQGPSGKPIVFPKGGVVLFGASPTAGATGVPSGADWLRQASAPGNRISFDTEAAFVPMSQSKTTQIPLMMNPNDPAERQYVLDIAKELVQNYALDGFIYDDRFRYAGLNADFSPVTRDLFEQQVGKKLTWPDDVFKFTLNQSLTKGLQPGPYYDAWMAWRAGRLKEFIQQVRHEARLIRPTVQIGLYVGSWYGEYPALGDNYAASQVEAGFWFLTPAYQQTGLASAIDFLIAGCYYPTATIYDALGRGQGIGSTIEASGSLVNRLVCDQTWTYAGISLDDYAGSPDALQNALQAACASTQGVMVFDLSHNVEPLWPVFARAFGQPRVPPHARPNLLTEVRRRRANLEKFGYHASPIPIAAGSSGTGQ